MVDHLQKYPGATASEMSRNMEPRRTQQTLDYTAKRLLEAGYLLLLAVIALRRPRKA